MKFLHENRLLFIISAFGWLSLVYILVLYYPAFTLGIQVPKPSRGMQMMLVGLHLSLLVYLVFEVYVKGKRWNTLNLLLCYISIFILAQTLIF